MAGETLPPNEERRRLFDAFRTECWRRELSNAEHFDKAILAYATAGLGFSLAFVKDVVPIVQARLPCLLYGSWSLFALAIVLTIVSYVLSQLGIKRQLALAEAYCLKGDDDAFHRTNPLAVWTEIVSYGAGLFFILAVVVTTAFVGVNLGRSP